MLTSAPLLWPWSCSGTFAIDMNASASFWTLSSCFGTFVILCRTVTQTCDFPRDLRNIWVPWTAGWWSTWNWIDVCYLWRVNRTYECPGLADDDSEETLELLRMEQELIQETISNSSTELTVQDRAEMDKRCESMFVVKRKSRLKWLCKIGRRWMKNVSLSLFWWSTLE